MKPIARRHLLRGAAALAVSGVLSPRFGDSLTGNADPLKGLAA